MSPGEIFALCFAAVAVTCFLPFLFSRRPKRPDFYEEIAHTCRGFEPPQPQPPRVFGKRRTIADPNRRHLRQALATIYLTPRQIERINVQRRLRGKPAFNRAGLQNAIAHPWDRPDVRQPSTGDDWLAYLIAYEILLSDHSSPMCSGVGGITIDPTAPYNGQGGEFGGAGASGDWGNPVTRAEASAIGLGAAVPASYVAAPVAGASIDNPGPSGDAPPPAVDTPVYTPDPAPSTPSYTPDPSPSYSPDPSPSYSSSDTGSSFSSGDSGGGSFGGGDVSSG